MIICKCKLFLWWHSWQPCTSWECKLGFIQRRTGITQPTQLFTTSTLVRVDNATHKFVSSPQRPPPRDPKGCMFSHQNWLAFCIQKLEVVRGLPPRLAHLGVWPRRASSSWSWEKELGDTWDLVLDTWDLVLSTFFKMSWIPRDCLDSRTLSFRHAASLAYCPIQSINHHHHHQEQPQQQHHTITNSYQFHLHPWTQNPKHNANPPSWCKFCIYWYKMLQGTRCTAWLRQNAPASIMLE